MKEYRYKVYREKEAPRVGSLFAATPQEAAAKLREKGFRIIRLEPVPKKRFAKRPFFNRRKLSVFCREWASLLDAGISHTAALSMLAEHEGPKEKPILLAMAAAITDGTETAGVFRRSGEFPEFFCAMLGVGELSGTLPEELRLLAAHYERERKFRKKITAALSYPLFVLLFACCVFLLILIVVLPSFSLLFQTLSVPLPAVTAAALSLGLFLQKYGLFLLLVLLLAMLALSLYAHTEAGAGRLCRILLRFRFVKRLLLIRFATALSALLTSGAPLSEALSEAAAVTENTEARRRIAKAAKAATGGVPLSQALADADFTLPLLTPMIAAGLESGRLPEFLDRAALIMTQETEEKLERFKTVAEPALLLFVGALTAAIIFTVMLPVFGAIGRGL